MVELTDKDAQWLKHVMQPTGVQLPPSPYDPSSQILSEPTIDAPSYDPSKSQYDLLIQIEIQAYMFVMAMILLCCFISVGLVGLQGYLQLRLMKRQRESERLREIEEKKKMKMNSRKNDFLREFRKTELQKNLEVQMIDFYHRELKKVDIEVKQINGKASRKTRLLHPRIKTQRHDEQFTSDEESTARMNHRVSTLSTPKLDSKLQKMKSSSPTKKT